MSRIIRLMSILTGVGLIVLAAGCGQHYSEKDADTALAERGLIPLPDAAAAAAASPHSGAPGAAVVTTPEGMARIGEDLLASVPVYWESETPSSTMRLAQFVVRDASSAAELAVFSGQWGTIDDNVSRWIGQFTQPNGGSTQERTQRWEIRSEGGIDITMVDIPGTFGGGMGGGEAQTNYRMLGAIVPVNGTFYYFKFTGSEALIATQREAFNAFVQSLTTS
jgi:hypothetical protein